MKKQLIFILSFSITIVMACEEINPGIDKAHESGYAPSITAFNPESAICGTEVTLFGENFGTFVSDNFVTFDSWGSEPQSGRIAEVMKVSHSGELIVRIPMNLVPGDYTISLQAKGNSRRSEKIFKIMGNE